MQHDRRDRTRRHRADAGRRPAAALRRHQGRRAGGHAVHEVYGRGRAVRIEGEAGELELNNLPHLCNHAPLARDPDWNVVARREFDPDGAFGLPEHHRVGRAEA